jgi:Pyridoxamine 5'-phosphate oxidase
MPLPEWPTGTIAVLSTVDAEPYAIPVTAPVRTADRRILFALKRTRASLERLRKHPQVALILLAKEDVAFTARGRAQVVQDPMVRAPDFAAVALDVAGVDDHRSPSLAVDCGVSLDWTNDATHRFLQQHMDALREVAASEK